MDIPLMSHLKMGMYVSGLVCCTCSFWLRIALYFSISGLVTGVINKHCVTFDEHLSSDFSHTVTCDRSPGLGPYAECTIGDFAKDLSELGAGVRSLCIYSKATFIPSNAFSHLTALELLQIDGDGLRSIDSGAFSGLFKLKYLRLSFDIDNCNTIALGNSLFDGLAHLEELSLKGISLAGIPYTIFDRLVGLVNLTLHYVCMEELGEVFCRLSSEMSHLRNLAVKDSNLTLVRKGNCPSSSRSWPLTVLSGIQTLDLCGNPLKIIEADSLVVLQNISSLSLSYNGAWLGSIWESGLGKINYFRLCGTPLYPFPVDFKDLCDLQYHLKFQSFYISHAFMSTLLAKDLVNCGADLKELGIYNVEIQQVDPGFWTSLSGLQAMLMGHMKLTEAQFCVSGNRTVWNITTLGLMYNNLKMIKTDQFVCMPLLEQLLLNNNNISILEPGAFRGLLHLTVLDLDSNHIKILSANDFESLGALKTLLISNNLIEAIENGVFRDQTELEELALGKLVYVYRLFLNLIFYGFPENIKRLCIDAGYGTSISLGTAGLPNGTFVFELTGETLYMDYYAPFFKAVRKLKLTGGYFFMAEDFVVPYFVNLNSLELTGNPEKHNDYTGINALHYLKCLKLVNLNFFNKTNLVMTFQNLKQLQILVLVNCRLSFLTKTMFRDLQSLRLLRLYSVSPLILMDGMFDMLPTLTVFVLDRVDFRCDCENGWLLEWAESTRVQVIYMQRQKCIWHYQKLNFLSTMEKLCQTDVQYLCYMGTAICVTLLLSAAVGYRFARWPCVVLFFRLRGYAERKLGRRWWRKRRRVRHVEGQVEEEEEEKYDAFVSFSNHDEDWVLGEMAPKLEEQGEPRLRLCLHHRDFEVGKGIVDNIAESVYSSRRTVCVLTRRYLRSDWCSLEMRMATYRLLEEQQHRLILIFLEHISPFELTAFHRLAKLVKSRTYLDWPQNEVERIHFWERLRRNIASGDMDCPAN